MMYGKSGMARVALCLSFFFAVAACQFSPPSLKEQLAALSSNGFSGAVLVAEEGVILHEQSYGFASCNDTELNSVDTVFSIGSITKNFTATAIAQLDAAGLLRTENSIDFYLENVPEDKVDITIQQLLDHRSGLHAYHETQNLGDFEWQTREEAVAEIFRKPLLFSSNSNYEYSNSGFTLLAAIIEEVSGLTYTQYIRERLLIPSGMTSTGFWGESISPMASTQNDVLGCSSPGNWQYSWVLVGNGGMVSTIGDMRKWIYALYESDLLDEPTKQKFGYNDLFRGGLGVAGGSSQHDFSADIEFSSKVEFLVIAVSNTDNLRAEFIAISLLKAAIKKNRNK
ncbi:MAG: hypothetical protein COA96_15260 [SAR86 cluster bacterium]|uniref:Beta-lactamase-related domain-containing protein n=1 Tax=SAR86 cluster bacterium TaxID=2030880 RepID=A0A2A5ARE1_9GAMM|nr:MAG: hypothetical protein COA96_15260 [SAR86 cluster bacterium]